jgi:hypothetical protein
MKRYKLLLIIMMMSCSTFSQGLKPIIQRTLSDTLYCFTRPQTLSLAELITAGAYNDSIAQSTEAENNQLLMAIANKDTTISALNVKAKNTETIMENQEKSLIAMRGEIKNKDATIKSERKQKSVIAIVLVVVTVLALL